MNEGEGGLEKALENLFLSLKTFQMVQNKIFHNYKTTKI